MLILYTFTLGGFFLTVNGSPVKHEIMTTEDKKELNVRQLDTAFPFPTFTGFPDRPTFTGFPDRPTFTGFPDLPSFTDFPDFPSFTGFPDFPSFTGFPDFPTFTMPSYSFPTFSYPDPPAMRDPPPPPPNAAPPPSPSTTSPPLSRVSSDIGSAATSLVASSFRSGSSVATPTVKTNSNNDGDNYGNRYTPPWSPLITIPQVIGIAIGGFCIFSLAFVLFYLHYRRRKSRQLKNQKNSIYKVKPSSAPTPPPMSPPMSPTVTHFDYGANYQAYQPYLTQRQQQQQQQDQVYYQHYSEQQQYHQQQPQQQQQQQPVVGYTDQQVHYQQQPMSPVIASVGNVVRANSTYYNYTTPTSPLVSHSMEALPNNNNNPYTMQTSLPSITSATTDIYPPAPAYQNFAPKPNTPSPRIIPATVTPTASTSNSVDLSHTSSDLQLPFHKPDQATITDKPHTRS